MIQVKGGYQGILETCKDLFLFFFGEEGKEAVQQAEIKNCSFPNTEVLAVELLTVLKLIEHALAARTNR